MIKAVMAMKAVRIHEFGSIEKLNYEEAPVPELKEGEVLVRVHAASVNPIDFKRALGTSMPTYQIKTPWIPGGDFSGVVEAVGSGVITVKPGEAVYGNCQQGGGYAQFVATKADTLALKPRALNYIDAASVPLAAQTAWQALFDHGHLRAGQSVLIHAGAGGVGTFAIQFAHWKGAKVFTTASAHNIEFLKSLGADEVIDYKKERFESVVKNVDLVIDLMGGETQQRSFGVLKAGGTLISAVQSPSQEEANKYKVNAKAMHLAPSTKLLTEIADLLDTGIIQTVVCKTYPLAQARDAWVDILSGHTRGKIVLIVTPEE